LVADLVKLASALRLTQAQRCFAQALAIDPEKNQTRAAMAAGSPPRSAAVTASKWLKLAKVQSYLAALTKAAEEEVTARTGAQVAKLAEILEMLTAQLRLRPQAYMKATETGALIDVGALQQAPNGVVCGITHERGDLKVVFASPQMAAFRLLEHYEMAAGLQPLVRSQPFTVNILTLPEETLRLLDRARAELEAQARAKAEGQALPVSAKVVAGATAGNGRDGPPAGHIRLAPTFCRRRKG
jgi:Terminase small subunit